MYPGYMLIIMPTIIWFLDSTHSLDFITQHTIKWLIYSTRLSGLHIAHIDIASDKLASDYKLLSLRLEKQFPVRSTTRVNVSCTGSMNVSQVSHRQHNSHLCLCLVVVFSSQTSFRHMYTLHIGSVQ